MVIIMLMRRPFVLSSSMTGMHSSTSGALRRGPLCFTMCGGAVWGTVEFFLRSLLRVAFRLPLRHATRWRGRMGRSQCTSYNRFSSGRNGALTGPRLLQRHLPPQKLDLANLHPSEKRW